jgi:hypothetical protein
LQSLSASIASAAGTTDVKLLRNINVAIIESSDISLTAAALGSNPNVKSSEADSIVQTAGVPNDQLWSVLWGMETVQAPAAWDITTGSSGNVVVCVIDSGKSFIIDSIAKNALLCTVYQIRHISLPC